MNGAESLIHTAAAAGVEICFANPGTTEIHVVAAMDKVPGIRGILGVSEGVCTGAADGYGRMADKPALTLLHLGPGFANGIANLHNARRARSPVVNLIGDHATWHLESDPPLASDIISLATPVSSWVRKATQSEALSQDVAEAIAAASSPPGSVSTLIIPNDCSWDQAVMPARPIEPAPAPAVARGTIQALAGLLHSGAPAALLLGGHGLRERGLRAAARIAAVTSCCLFSETFTARFERGAGLPYVAKLPYFPEQVLEALGAVKHLLLAGAVSPVAFFGYPGQHSHLVPKGCEVHKLASPTDDVIGALEALADELGAPQGAGSTAPLERPKRPHGSISPSTMGAAVAFVQPEGAIIMDEAATSRIPYVLMAPTCPPHTYLTLTGGAIGHGLPCAIGAAIARPERPVIALEADGCALYTAQALWTQAREGLNVTTIISANRMYRIIRLELARAGLDPPGSQANALTDLSNPVIDWVAVSRGLGVPAVRVERSEDLVTELERTLAEPGPHLIEAVMAD